MDYLKRSWADISLDNLQHNYQELRKKIPSETRFLGVVKADAYGHGAVPISRHLRELGAQFLAVSNIEEAAQLRYAGIRGPILILGYTPVKHAEDLAKMGLRQEVHSLEYAQALNEQLRGLHRRVKIHLKLDTGMSRLGFFAYDHPEVLQQFQAVAAMENLYIEGVFTHFPVADSLSPEDEAFTRMQFRRFMDMISAMESCGIHPEIRHCCNSGGTILYPEYALDMVRPGIATYGVHPSAELEDRIDLKPVMSLHSTIFQIRDYEPNISVSYGRTYTTVRKERIAVVGIGYADGLSRSFSGKISFRLHGKRVQQVGRICMDMCMVNISNVPEAKVGDQITIFGDGAGVETLADQLGTIPYEILCGINKRIPRIYLDGENQTEILQYIV